MDQHLQPGGEVLVSFGPTWYHPLGGHLFSVFPWAHLIFSEKALISWRSAFKTDGATRFSEVAGGLNQMTIAKFEALVAAARRSLQSRKRDWLRLSKNGKLVPPVRTCPRESAPPTVEGQMDYGVRSVLAFGRTIVSCIRPITNHFTYTTHSGIAAGLKRRGGIGFLPRSLTEEERFYQTLDLRGKTEIGRASCRERV